MNGASSRTSEKLDLMGIAAAPKLAILGNCQAQIIEGLFSLGAEVEILSLPPNFLMTADDEERVESALRRADFVFAQRTSDDFSFPWLRSNEIRSRAPDRTWVWPNLYFDGFFPGVQYLYLPRWDKVDSPLQDYHFTSLISAHHRGLSFDEALAAFLARPEEAADPFASSLAQLTARERDCDIVMSDVIAAAVHESQCFLTPNHPVNPLVVALVARMAERAGIPLSRERCLTFGHQLDHIEIPIFDWVAERYALEFPRSPLFKGVACSVVDGAGIVTSGRRTYDAQQLVRAYLDIYRVVMPH